MVKVLAALLVILVVTNIKAGNSGGILTLRAGRVVIRSTSTNEIIKTTNYPAGLTIQVTHDYVIFPAGPIFKIVNSTQVEENSTMLKYEVEVMQSGVRGYLILYFKNGKYVNKIVIEVRDDTFIYTK